jgi:hypothetical protein
VTAADRFAVPDDVMARPLDGETVILDLASGTYFGLDRVGTRIWELLREGKALGDVCTTLLGEFEASREQVEADVFELAQQLLDRRLIRPA